MLEFIITFITEITSGNFININSFLKLAKFVPISDSQESQKALQALTKWHQSLLEMPIDDKGQRHLLLGLSYEYGLGVKKNLYQAKLCYTQAKDLNNLNAICSLACGYYMGQWGKEDSQQAIQLWQQAADLGCAEALFAIGRFLVDGTEIPKDFNQGLHFLLKASKQNYTPAMIRLGIIYQYYPDVERNPETAYNWYLQACELGDSDAMLLAAEWRSTDNFSMPIANKEEDLKSIAWYKEASTLGNSLAMYRLGIFYKCGSRVEKNTDEAVKWLQKSGDLGHHEALYELGLMFDQPEYYIRWISPNDNSSFEQKQQLVIKWYTKASELGNHRATGLLAYYYRIGHSVPRNYRKAAQLERRAHLKGFSDILDDLSHDVYWEFHRKRYQKDTIGCIAILQASPQLFEEIMVFEAEFFPAEAEAILQELLEKDDEFFLTKLSSWLNQLTLSIAHLNIVSDEICQLSYQLMLKLIRLVQTQHLIKNPTAVHNLIEAIYCYAAPEDENYSTLLGILAIKAENLARTQIIPMITQAHPIKYFNVRLFANIIIKYYISYEFELSFSRNELTLDILVLLNDLLIEKNLTFQSINASLFNAFGCEIKRISNNSLALSQASRLGLTVFRPENGEFIEAPPKCLVLN